MKLYRIRRKSDGLFLSTSTYSRWTTMGKLYQRAGGCKAALTNLVGGAYLVAWHEARRKRRTILLDQGVPAFGQAYYQALAAHNEEFEAAGERAKAEALADFEVLELNLDDLPGTVLDLTEFRKTQREKRSAGVS